MCEELGSDRSGRTRTNRRKINILFLIDYFHRTGGTEKHLVQLVRHLRSDTFNCTIGVFDLGPNALLDEVRAAGIQVVHIPVAREYVPNAFARARELSAFITQSQIDIVQTFHQKADTYGALVAKLSGVKHLISSKRDTGQLRKPWHFFLNRRLRPLFERIIVVADAVGDAVVANDHVDRSRIVRIYNGVDTNEFAPSTRAEAAAERQRWGLGSDDFVVGVVAGFRPEKNHDVLFDAALQALPAIPSLKILAVGGGPLLEHYRTRCAAGSLRGRVVFAGDVKNVAQCLGAMDVGCLVPGSNEGFSNAVLEQMSAGLPMIVTAVGGNAEAVVDGENGFVIPGRDTPALVRAFTRMHADPARRLAMGQRSRALVESRFSLTQMRERHEQLYLSLCA
jgi:glycosyltransferase involved in cell wall biosynthesis